MYNAEQTRRRIMECAVRLFARKGLEATSVADIIVVGYTEGGVPGERVGAIVHPDEEWFKAQNGGTLPEWEAMEKSVIKAVQTRCAELADYKRVRKVVAYRDPLERTSVGKIRRVKYQGKLDE